MKRKKEGSMRLKKEAGIFIFSLAAGVAVGFLVFFTSPDLFIKILAG